MMRYIIFVLLLMGCVSSKDVLDPNLATTIPGDSELVIAITNIDSDSLYSIVERQLIRDGHRVQNSDKELLSISTEGIDIGQSTLARYTLYVEDGKLFGRVDWSTGMAANAMASAMSGIDVDSGWEKATWSKGRPKRAFASLVSFMSSIPHDRLDYK